jgi:GT2 family glycosyltransferase
MRPLVDFAILSYNRIDEAITAIESALAQEGVDVHVFVVDQNSDAAAFERLERHCRARARVTLVRNDSNTGVAAGRNQAMALGSAPFIIGLDDDATLPDPHQALRAVMRAEADPKVGAVAFNLVDYDSREAPEPIRNVATRVRTGLPVTTFIGAAFLVRRTAFDAAGGFDERIFFYHEEGDLCFRIINLGFKVAYAPDATALHSFSSNREPHESPRRWYFHVRHSIYLAAKYNLSPLGAPGVLGSIILEGLRRGLYASTARGIVSGVTMIPAGLKQRFGDARVRLTPRARRILRSGSPTADMSLPQRLAYRMGLRADRS